MMFSFYRLAIISGFSLVAALAVPLSARAQDMPNYPATTPAAPAKSAGTTTSNAGSKSGKEADKPVIKPNVPPANARKNTLAVTPLSASDWREGCGCRFYKPTDQRESGPLLLRLDDKKKAAIRVEEQLDVMRLVDERHVLKKPPAILANDRMMLKFKGQQTSASFSGSAERNCPKFNDACKSITYQGVLSVARGDKQGAFPVWGVCGCEAQGAASKPPAPKPAADASGSKEGSGSKGPAKTAESGNTAKPPAKP